MKEPGTLGILYRKQSGPKNSIWPAFPVEEGRGRGWRGDAAALQPECRAPVAICYRLRERLFTRFIAASDTNYWISFLT